MRALIALALVGALATGCTGGEAPEGAPTPTMTPTTSTPPLPDGSDTAWRTGVFVALPLDDYVSTGAGAQTVLDGNRLLMRRCMRAKGFTYLASRLVDSGSVAYPYGPTDPTAVATYGYTQAPIAVSTKDQPRRSRDDAPLSIAYLQALLGRSAPASLVALPDPGPGGPVTLADGCTGQATLGLGPLPDPTSLVGRLGLQAQQRVTDDARVRGAIDRWSACMDGAGHPYESPMAALQRVPREVPAQEQVAIALADVACKAASDLPRTWQTVEAGLQQPLVDAERAALEQVRTRSRAQVARAAALLAADTDPPEVTFPPALQPGG